jgi:hypothetical protein
MQRLNHCKDFVLLRKLATGRKPSGLMLLLPISTIVIFPVIQPSMHIIRNKCPICIGFLIVSLARKKRHLCEQIMQTSTHVFPHSQSHYHAGEFPSEG